MAKKAPARKMDPPQVVLDRFEAEAGIFSLPITIAEEGQEPYHPEILLLVAVDGPILFEEMERPGLLEARAGFLLRGALKRLQYLPGTLRVASGELAEALRPQITARVALVNAPTPHLLEVLEELTAHMSQKMSYLAGGASPDEVGAFFRAGVRLHRARPWTAIPRNGIVGVTIEALGVHDAALILVAPDPDGFPGWSLAETPEDFDRFADAVESRDEGGGGEVPFPAIQSFELEAISALPPALAREIRQHGWETAGAICPWTGVTGEDGERGNPSAAELAVGAAISLALAQLVPSAGRIRKAFAGKSVPFDLAIPLEIFGGRKVEVVLTVPYVMPRVRGERPDHPLLAGLYDLEGAAIDRAARRRLENELLEPFAASSAGKDVGPLEWLRLLLDLAAERQGLTAASLGGPELESLLLEAIPQSVQIEPADAARVAEECRAFFRFLRDDCGHALSGGALEILERHNFVADLEAAFGNVEGYGFGKRLIAAGALAGFDVQSPEGLEAWLRKVNQTGLPPGVAPHPLLGDLDTLPLASKAGDEPAGGASRRPGRKK